MYEAKTSLINGNLVNDLLSICNDLLLNTMVQSYAGANPECLFCGTTENRSGIVEHQNHDGIVCPVVRYKMVFQKHSDLLKEK